MRRLLHIFANDMRRHVRAPFVVIIYMAIPLVMTGLIGLVFGPKPGAGELPRIKVFVADEDKSLGARLFLGAFDSDRLKDMFEVTSVSQADGRAAMNAGKASALVIIPKGFTLDLLDGKAVTLDVVKNPAEQFLPDVAEEAVNTMAVMLSGAVQAFADEAKGVRALLDKPVGAVDWASLSPEFGKAQKKVVAATRYLDPLLIRLKTEDRALPGARPTVTRTDIFSVVLPGMAVMFLLFIIQTVMRDFITEREDGTLRRMLTSPVRPLELVGARILGAWVMGVAVLLVMTAAGSLLFGARWGNLAYYLVLGVTTAFWTSAFFACFYALVRNRNQAGAFGAPVILVFSLFGGSMLDPSAMPRSLAKVGLFTPNRWFIDGAALARDGQFPTVSVAVLAVSGLVLLGLAVPGLTRKARG
jgi:ABC-2 type transport system permease protein